MQYAGFPFIRVGITDHESHGDVLIKHLNMGFMGIVKEKRYFHFAGLGYVPVVNDEINPKLSLLQYYLTRAFI
jgi:hypothetical protein